MQMPALFSDGMVLQQQTGALVWGWADEGTNVTVEFAGRIGRAKADADGKWQVNLENLRASGKGAELTVRVGNEKRVISNVLVGEVWIASGQSNMERRIPRTTDKKKALKAKDSQLRVFLSRNVARGKPQRDFPGRWAETKAKNNRRFTAVGYQFGKVLREALDVPVGIIECAWGGKPVQAFVSTEALEKLPEGKMFLEQRAKAMAKKSGNKAGKNPNLAGNIFNGMINPIAGYGARGVIWYQGESNARHGVAGKYAELQAAMVRDWRERWGRDLSFYYVQLANYKKATEKPGVESTWVTVQDEQRQMLGMLEHVGMAVINDIGEAGDIHPKNKKDVGRRLARWALNRDYGKKNIVPSGPLYLAARFKDGQAEVVFKHAEGLKTRDGKPLQRVEIAGADGKWHWAEVVLQDDRLFARCKEVEKPKKLRYAWASNPTGATLVNAEGLPASVFTTED